MTQKLEELTNMNFTEKGMDNDTHVCMFIINDDKATIKEICDKFEAIFPDRFIHQIKFDFSQDGLTYVYYYVHGERIIPSRSDIYRMSEYALFILANKISKRYDKPLPLDENQLIHDLNDSTEIVKKKAIIKLQKYLESVREFEFFK